MAKNNIVQVCLNAVGRRRSNGKQETATQQSEMVQQRTKRSRGGLQRVPTPYPRRNEGTNNLKRVPTPYPMRTGACTVSQATTTTPCPKRSNGCQLTWASVPVPRTKRGEGCGLRRVPTPFPKR